MEGEKLAYFRVGELIGQGGMGNVYRARDTRLDRDVALKILPEEFVRDRERLALVTGWAGVLGGGKATA